MYFDASESLLNEAPSLQPQIEAVDHFFEKRLSFSDVVAPATEIAQKAQIEVADAHRILHRLVEKDALSRLFVPICTRCRDITGFYPSFDAIPDVFTCDECGMSHTKDETNVFLMYQAKKDSPKVHPTQGRGTPSAETGQRPSKFTKEGRSVTGSSVPDVDEQDSLRALCETLQITIEHLHLGDHTHDQSVRVDGQSRYDGGTQQDIRSQSGAIDASRSERAANVHAEGHSSVQLDQGSGTSSDSGTWKWAIGLLVTLILGIAGLAVKLYVADLNQKPAAPIREDQPRSSAASGTDGGLSPKDATVSSSERPKSSSEPKQ